MGGIVVGGVGGLPAVVVLREEVAQAAGYAEAARSASTRRLYAHDWSLWSAWCAARGIRELPADPRAVATFLATEAAAGTLPPTLNRRLSAIGYHHRRAGSVAPQRAEGAGIIAEVMAGIRRSRVSSPTRKDAADGDVVRDMLRAIPGDDLRSVRDRAIIGFGMSGAFRRSELVALQLSDLIRDREGFRVLIRRSKTDQEGEGETIAIPDGRRLRPVALLEAWIAAACLDDGFVFRRLDRYGAALADPVSDRHVALVVKKAAAAAGYDPERFSGHSLRAGFVTSAARGGAGILKIREVSRHKSMDVLAGYVRESQLYRDHAGDDFL